MVSAAEPVYQNGIRGLKVSRTALHGSIRKQVVKRMRKELGDKPAGIAILQGGKAFHVHNTDTELVFRQEAYFLYCFGVLEEDYYGAIDLRDEKSILFMPLLPESYAVWMGEIPTRDKVKAAHGVDEVYYVDDMADVLTQLDPPVLHVLKGVNSDSGQPAPTASFPGMHGFKVEDAVLFPVLTDCRVHKTEEELAVMRFANEVASAAHVAVMQSVQPGMVEYDCEALFLYECYRRGGCRLPAYTPICASGPNGAVLHYGHVGAPNNRTLLAGDMLLCDMGCEYYRYESDITCTWPVDGRFTPEQRLVYNAVLKANREVIAAMKPGVHWPDMHRLAERIILAALKAGGLLQGEVGDMMAVHLGAVFMPHGLGHFLGLDTHDVGGYMDNTPPRIQAPGINRLRTARVLEAGMVITVEPGCYFNQYTLNKAFANDQHLPFLVKDEILKFWEFGGVRIEDNVVVQQEGAVSMTHVPRSVEDIEAVMAGKAWPPR